MAQSKDKMCEIDEHMMKRFDIQKRLGKGAYGIVWKAIDRKTKDVVAVKKIFDAFRNQTDAQRTYREIMFLQSFKSHPNIVKLHSIHRAVNNRDIYLGFEYMETDLHNVIKRKNILKDVHHKYIIYQLLKAIKYIHSGNVIHRDMKPSNVLLDSLCRCKIADFGLARSLSLGSEGVISDGDPTLTDYVATRWYRAPEILIANRRYTKGIDLWSLGCILAEMTLGKPIFPGTSTVNQVEKIMATIPTPTTEDIAQVCVSGIGSSMIKNTSSIQKVPIISILGPNVPSEALDLINKLLVFNPHKRLNADEALEHPYVAKFHNVQQEIVMESSVTIPLNDDIRLSVDDYRNKLYELMSTHTQRMAAKCLLTKAKVNPPPPVVYSRMAKNTENYFKNHVIIQDRSYFSQSEPKMNVKKIHWIHSANIKSDSKVTTKPVSSLQKVESIKASGDSKMPKSHHDFLKKRNSQKNVVYNSMKKDNNKSHGVITQSALMELRAAGLR